MAPRTRQSKTAPAKPKPAIAPVVASALKALALAAAAAVVLPWDIALIPGPLPRANPQTEHTGPIDAPAYTRETLRFASAGGVECEAWLYRPKAPAGSPPPVVVMAHGLVRCCCCLLLAVQRERG